MPVLRVIVLAVALLLTACSMEQLRKEIPQLSKGEDELNDAIRYYEDGNYLHAQADLQSALESGLTRESEVKAHKYLAFIHCISGRENQCRDEFKKALEIDPELELTPAETGHPVWGQVFRNVKLTTKPKK